MIWVEAGLATLTWVGVFVCWRIKRSRIRILKAQIRTLQMSVGAMRAEADYWRVRAGGPFGR